MHKVLTPRQTRATHTNAPQMKYCFSNFHWIHKNKSYFHAGFVHRTALSANHTQKKRLNTIIFTLNTTLSAWNNNPLDFELLTTGHNLEAKYGKYQHRN